MVNEVQNALWRSGDVMDGVNFKLNFVGEESNNDQSPSKSSKLLGSKSRNEIQLKDLLIEVVRRNNGAKMWQFNKKVSQVYLPYRYCKRRICKSSLSVCYFELTTVWGS